MGIIDIIRRSLVLFFKNFKDMLIALIIFSIFRGILTSILVPIFGGANMNVFSSHNMMNIMDRANRASETFSYTFITDFIDYLILGTNSIAILELLRGGYYSIGLVLDKFRENSYGIIIVSGILALISTVFSFIPLFGTIISILVIPGFSYAYFLLEDDYEETAINSLINSYQLTNGHKLNLVILVIFFRVIPFLLGVIVFTTLFPFLIFGLGFISLLLFIATFIFSSFIDMLTTIGLSIYYEAKTFENII